MNDQTEDAVMSDTQTPESSAVAADSDNESPPKTKGEQSSGGSKWGVIVLVAAVLLAGGAIAFRALSGSDDAAPVVAEVDEDGFVPLSVLQERAEADPMNAEAWQELGFAHYQREEYAEAARAYRQAVEGDDSSAILWSALGEARILENDRDPMPAAAVTAFQRALELDPTDARARYFLAVKKDIDGDPEGAISDWLSLLEDTPPGAPWEMTLRQTIDEVGKIDKIETESRIAAADEKRPGAELTAGNAIPGPSQQQIASAAEISPDDQRSMAENMVDRLDARLKNEPKNVDGWVMLMRSRINLGQPDRATQALADAIAANPDDAARLRQEAEILGVE